MKTILVDAVNTFVVKDKGINQELYKLLENYENRKIILTNANDEQMKQFRLNDMPYEVFSLKHNPDKADGSKYYQKMLKHFNLKPEEVIYIEHNREAIRNAESVGIKSYRFEIDKKDEDIQWVQEFIDSNFGDRVEFI